MTSLSALSPLDPGTLAVAPRLPAGTKLKALIVGPGTCMETAPIVMLADNPVEMEELRALYPGASWVSVEAGG